LGPWRSRGPSPYISSKHEPEPEPETEPEPEPDVFLSFVRITEIFDYVVCASGHYSFPNYPSFEGFDTFQGRVLHAHDMRDAVEFKGKDLLLIGTSYSAEDIASQCWKYGAKSVTISHRTKPIGYETWPENIIEVPLLTKVVSNLAPDGNGELEQGGIDTGPETESESQPVL